MEFILLGIVISVSVVTIASLLFIREGSTGITKPYKTKDGTSRTAKAARVDYIV